MLLKFSFFQFREKPQKPKNADVSKTYFSNNSSLAYGTNMKFGPKLHIIKRIILKKKFFEILMTSAKISKIRKFAIKCLRQHNFKKFFFQNDPFDEVQLWSKFHVCTICQTGVIKKTSFADVSIFWFLRFFAKLTKAKFK